MSDYRDGQIHGWNGGECPAHPKDEVRVWLRGGSYVSTRSPVNQSWGHNQSAPDIIAFCVTKRYEEPLTVWVNLLRDGSVEAWETELGATEAGASDCARIAVKFQEVKE